MSIFKQASVSLATLLFGVSGLIGCSSSFDAPTSAVTTSIASIQGRVYGGQQPVVAAKIYLMQANPTVWKGAATSLLTFATGNFPDANGNYYVTTSANGSFTISGDYTCTSGTQIYLIGVGGNSLGTNPTVNNSAIVQMALLGQCPNSGNFLSTIAYITLNEVSTVAAAYAVAGFASDYQHIGRWATNAENVGLGNAFLGAANITSLGAGTAYTATPSGNGVVPQAKIYTLADIIAACVNTTSNTSTACTKLFNATPSSTGAAPTTTFDAILNLAQNPTINTTNTGLITLATALSPFFPDLPSNPNDWTLSLQYTAPNSSQPGRPDVDASGNIWIPNQGNNTLTELSPVGALVSPSAGFSGGALNQPLSVSVNQPTGQVWVGNYNADVASVFTTFGTATTSNGYTTNNGANYGLATQGSTTILAGFNGIAQLSNAGTNVGATTSVTINSAATINPNAAVWSSQYFNNSIAKIPSGSNTATVYTGGGLNTPAGIASDFGGNIWVANSGSNTASAFTLAGTVSTGSPYSGAGLSSPYMVKTDGYNRPWFANKNATISALTTTGTPFSGGTGYITASNATYSAGATDANGFNPSAILGLTIDQAGNIWAPDRDGHIYEFLGLTTPPVPIIQPLQIACGGETVSSPVGTWVSDNSYINNGNTFAGATAVTTPAVVNPAPQAVYQNERYGSPTYTITGLTAGTLYTVNLHFAEIYWNQGNTRVFNVAINGTQVLTNFDIWTQAGGENVGIIRSFSATADNSGTITIGFTAVKDNAKCSGIQITRS